MVHDYLILVSGLILAVLILVMVGQKLKISYPIFLVIAGLLISLIPGLPHIRMNADLVFLIFLPPILYEAAWYTSWHDFWKWRRPISLMAFGLVFFTSVVVAFVAEAMIPGFTLALGFLLGGIISPPDAVAATSVLKGVSIPKRLITILEGESLVNDASSLVVVKFALAAVMTGYFSLQKATEDFFIMAFMGILIGLLIGLFIYFVHKKMPTTPSIDVALTLLTPYLMYITAEHYHFSGVLAVVAGGLFLSSRSHEIFSYESRMQAIGVWHTVIFMVNGTVFILIGLELPVVMSELGDVSKTEIIGYGVIISAILIAIRFLWTYAAAFGPRLLFKSIREKENSPGWKGPFLISIAGMRGVVSLAAVFSVPVLLTDGQVFPQRNILLLITFVVIIITLVGQGLLLPYIIRWLDIEEIDQMASDEEQQADIMVRLNKKSLDYINQKHSGLIFENELVANFVDELENDMKFLKAKIASLECAETEKNNLSVFRKLLQDVYDVQRRELVHIRNEKIFSDHVLRKQAAKIDLDEAILNQH